MKNIKIDLYRLTGLNFVIFVLLFISTVWSDKVAPLVFIVLTISISVYIYLVWVRNLSQNFLLAVLLVPIFALPLAFFMFVADMNPASSYSLCAAFIMGIGINLVIWGKRAVPQKK